METERDVTQSVSLATHQSLVDEASTRLRHGTDRRSEASPKMDVTEKFKLIFMVLAVAVLMSFLKAGVHWFSLEFLTVNTLLTSGIGGAIFILAFLLSKMLADQKKTKRIASELRVALEAIHSAVTNFASTNEKVDLQAFRVTLTKIMDLLRGGPGHAGGHGNLGPILDEIDKLSGFFSHLDQLGVPASYIVRLRTAQDSLRRSVSSLYHIHTIQFAPWIHLLARTLIVSIILLLLFLKTEGSPESTLLFGFICYLFVCALYLIQLLEKDTPLLMMSAFSFSRIFRRKLTSKSSPPSDIKRIDSARA